jgi:hypothetical protein
VVGNGTKHRPELVEEPKPRERLLRLSRDITGAQLGQEPRQNVLVRRRGSFRIAVPPERPKDLDPGPEGRRAADFPAATPMDGESLLLRADRRLVGEPRLSDPRLPGDRKQAAGAAHRSIEARIELAEFLSTTDDDGLAVEHTARSLAPQSKTPKPQCGSARPLGWPEGTCSANRPPRR